MPRLTGARFALWCAGLQELPLLPELTVTPGDAPGRNGESLATDEAAVWKRVLDHRIAAHLQPARILETHAGLGLSAALYRHAAPRAEIVSLQDYRAAASQTPGFDLIDIDPFGQPYAALEQALPLLAPDGVLLISNGEALAVWRNLTRQQHTPTANCGKRLPAWVTDEYLPRLTALTGRPVAFFYAFPTSVRAVLTRRALPTDLWTGCPHWLWWLARYAEPPGLRLKEPVTGGDA